MHLNKLNKKKIESISLKSSFINDRFLGWGERDTVIYYIDKFNITVDYTF